jgi:hypothetical protein
MTSLRALLDWLFSKPQHLGTPQLGQPQQVVPRHFRAHFKGGNSAQRRKARRAAVSA